MLKFAKGQLLKFRAPYSNSFRDFLLKSLKRSNLQRATTPENLMEFVKKIH